MRVIASDRGYLTFMVLLPIILGALICMVVAGLALIFLPWQYSLGLLVGTPILLYLWFKLFGERLLKDGIKRFVL